MCGEHSGPKPAPKGMPGSSPHVRGAHSLYLRQLFADGIIPACAGSTRRRHGSHRHPADHPRMCGEHKIWIPARVSPSGSSPHVRGARRIIPAPPRRRGIIPACAGSTSTIRDVCYRHGDHPRMCGEHYNGDMSKIDKQGSSPHVRGALGPFPHVRPQRGIIPACAGSTAANAPTPKTIVGSSPHVRGAPGYCSAMSANQGIIPACAGSTFVQRFVTPPARDHPRMCGEHMSTARF